MQSTSTRQRGHQFTQIDEAIIISRTQFSRLIIGGILGSIALSLIISIYLAIVSQDTGLLHVLISGGVSVLFTLIVFTFINGAYQKNVTTIRSQQDELHQLTQSLNEAMHRLSERNTELNAYAHTVSHDLKSPLSAIRGFANLGLETLDRDPDQVFDPEDLQRLNRYFESVIAGTESVTEIIESLLLLATVRKEHVSINQLEMGALVNHAWESQRLHVQEYNAKLIQPGEWPQVQGYAPWVINIWANYMNNAIKYGGRPPVIEVGYDEIDSKTLRFWIKDNGRGFTAEEESLLFKEFSRLTREDIRGHGLGLSIVRRIAERMGGKVGAENIPDGGAMFWFTLRVMKYPE